MLGPLLALALAAQFAPSVPGSYDPRIQRVIYDPNQVVPVTVGRGYAAVIDLGADQVVESIVVGNATGWEITASKRGDHVVVKPGEGAAPTDLIVITASRRYVFLIQSADGAGAFVLSFSPPAEAAPVRLSATKPDMTARPSGFRFRGSKLLQPSAMRSDGQRTIITWAKATPIPAIFAVEDGHEAIVNGRMVGSDFVVEGTASEYIFRLGNEHSEAYRIKSVRSR